MKGANIRRYFKHMLMLAQEVDRLIGIGGFQRFGW